MWGRLRIRRLCGWRMALCCCSVGCILAAWSRISRFCSRAAICAAQVSLLVRDVTSSALEGEIVARELVDLPLNLQLKNYRVVHQQPRLWH